MPRRQVSDQRRTAVSDRSGMLRGFWLRERTQRPVATWLASIGGAMLTVGAGLAATSSALIGQLIAGVALLPLSVAVYLHLLPPSPWTLAQEGLPGCEPVTDDHDPALRSAGAGADVDWERFERQFRIYAAKRERNES